MEKQEQLKIMYLGTSSSKIEALYTDERFKMYKFTDPFAATDFLEKEKVHAVICDLEIKHLSGIDYFEHFHKCNTPSSCICFLLLEKHDISIIKLALKKGIDDVYIVPFSADAVYKRVMFLSEIKTNGTTKKSKKSKKSKKKTENKYKLQTSKRIFDIVVASSVLLILSPLLLVVLLLIRLESKGNVFYVSKRVGSGYKIFDFYKLRSMHQGADTKLKDMKTSNQYALEVKEETTDEECPECKRLGHLCSPILYIDGHEVCENHYLKMKKSSNESTFVKFSNNPRITKIGKFIRNTSIDELPQLINVLKGDMSIVGNRPLPLYEAELLTTDDWSERFLAPAGLTGLWQVEKRGRSGSMSAEERKQLDNTYAGKFSLLYDMKLIFQTIPALFQSDSV